MSVHTIMRPAPPNDDQVSAGPAIGLPTKNTLRAIAERVQALIDQLPDDPPPCPEAAALYDRP